MKKRKLFIQAVCIILAVLMLLSISIMVIAPSAWAASSDEIQSEIYGLTSRQSEIQSRMDDIQAEIDSLDYEKANTLEKKQYLDRRNQLAQEELNVIQEQITIIDNLIANMQEDLTDAREEEAYQRERFLARVRAMEEKTDAGYMDVLFNATSLADLLTRLDLVSEIMNYDESLEEEYIAARQRVETLEAQAMTMFTENDARRQELVTKQAQLQTDIEAACALIAQMEQSAEDYEEILAQEEQTQAEIQSLIIQKETELAEAKAREEAARMAALAAQQAAEQAAQQQAPPSEDGGTDSAGDGAADEGSADEGSADEGGGSSEGSGSSGSGAWMIWPSYTRYLTDYYGPRPVHPVTGQSTFHDGIDIGASYGSSIYAAAGGTVIMAKESGGYGNCVMISHGNGYTTLYAHMSSISVSYGQSVSQGQVIGLVGATGRVTGPHLHFEVRTTSGSLDPMSFVYY